MVTMMWNMILSTVSGVGPMSHFMSPFGGIGWHSTLSFNIFLLKLGMENYPKIMIQLLSS